MASKKRGGLSKREFAAAQAGQPMPYDKTLRGSMTQEPSAPQLTGGTDLASLQTDVKTLSSQYHPGLLTNFTTLMQKISQNAYNRRMAASGKITDGQFDPTKVSGSTFSSIIDNLESGAGKDISKMYSSTIDAYTKSQEQIGDAIKEKQDLIEKIVSRSQSSTSQKAKLKSDLQEDLDFISGQFDQSKTMDFDKQMSKATPDQFVNLDFYNKQRDAFINAYYVDDPKAAETFDNYFSRYLSPEDQEKIAKTDPVERRQIASEQRKAASEEIEQEEAYNQWADLAEKITNNKKISMEDMKDYGIPIDPKLIKVLEGRGFTIVK
jgi:hypothetical protein